MKYKTLKFLVTQEQKKQALVDKIIAKKKNSLSRYELLAMDIQDLDKLIKEKEIKKGENKS